MSWDIEIDTSQRQRHQTTSTMFRMEEHRPFDPSIVDFRMTGRPQPTRARVTPTTFADTYDDERQGLVSGRRKRDGVDVQLLTVCTLGSVLLVLCVLMGAMYWQFTSGVAQMRDLTRPYAIDAINHTLSILHNVDHSTISAHEMADGARDLTAAAVPALVHALNQSSMIVDRLERLAQNPVLQLSLNTGTGR